LRILTLICCLLCLPFGLQAQQQPLENVLPDAPTPVTSSNVQQPRTKLEHKLEARSFRLMQGLFLSSARLDLSTTDDFLHHPQHVEYRAVCNGQPCSSMSYGYSPQWFTEVGRPARMFGCGPRSVGCSLMSNVANDATIFGVSEFLYHKGKFGKALAWGFLTAQAVSNFEAAWHNRHVVLNEGRYVPPGSTGIQWY